IAREIERHAKAAASAHALGLEVHAGHGLTYNTVAPIARLPEIVELNIGHFLMGEAIFAGLPNAVRRMRTLMEDARAERARTSAKPRKSA
ncbi:MAG: pyridoxine 5'-phosphate synthase, partial [Hyphomicrobium sp.]